MSKQDDIFKQFSLLVSKTRQEQLKRAYQQQLMLMDNDQWNRQYDSSPYTTIEAAKSQQEAARLRQMIMEQAIPSPEPPKWPKWQREIAAQVRCPRCKYTDPKNCWECSGTQITPIPFAEVMSGQRGEIKGKDSVANAFTSSLTLNQKNQKIMSQTMKVAGKGAYFK